MTRNKIRLIHIDDHVLFVQGVQSLLEAETKIHWIGSAGTVKEGLVLVEKHRPDLVLLDYFLPDGTGIDAAKKILSISPKIPILIITMENNPILMEKCKDVGLMAFLPKTIDKAQMIEAIDRAVIGFSTFPVLEKQKINGDPDLIKLGVLSKREKEIAYWIAQGLTSSQVSEKLFLSLLTVNTHRRNLLNKMAFNNTAQLSSLVSKYSREELGLGD